MESSKKKRKRERMEMCVQQEMVGQEVQNKEELMVSELEGVDKQDEKRSKMEVNVQQEMRKKMEVDLCKQAII